MGLSFGALISAGDPQVWTSGSLWDRRGVGGRVFGLGLCRPSSDERQIALAEIQGQRHSRIPAARRLRFSPETARRNSPSPVPTTGRRDQRLRIGPGFSSRAVSRVVVFRMELPLTRHASVEYKLPSFPFRFPRRRRSAELHLLSTSRPRLLVNRPTERGESGCACYGDWCAKLDRL